MSRPPEQLVHALRVTELSSVAEALAEAPKAGQTACMIVRVLYFAALRDLVGVREEQLELPDSPLSLTDLLAHLVERHAALSGRLQQVRVARNETFANLVDPVSHGDVIALIPPVAGG
ncbi:MAG TPA: molybdopterin converting factor subunit 1 [Polyangiaceae bacterium]